jgi:hypothetical protein
VNFDVQDGHPRALPKFVWKSTYHCGHLAKTNKLFEICQSKDQDGFSVLTLFTRGRASGEPNSVHPLDSGRAHEAPSNGEPLEIIFAF